MVAPPEPAATVVVLRDAPDLEVLLLQRSPAASTYAGAWVFPGGRIDAADGADADAAARIAAAREAAEEAALSVDPTELVPWAHWTTPEVRPRRFATWFFLARAPGEVRVDGREIVAHGWLRPAAALASHARGERLLLPPTWITLHALARFDRVDAALAHASMHPAPRFTPRTRNVPGGEVALYEGDAAYDGRALGEPGARRRLHAAALPWRFEES